MAIAAGYNRKTMFRWATLFHSLIIAFMLGAADVPSACLGDLHGGPCQAGACHCAWQCTCHADHEIEEQEARHADELARAWCSDRHAPHGPAATLACHSHQKHVTLSRRTWNPAPPEAFAFEPRFELPIVEPGYGQPRRAAFHTLAPPEQVPRATA